MVLTAVQRDLKYRLSFLDVTALKLMGATHRRQLIQGVWVYDRPIDVAGIQRFSDNFARGFGNRAIRHPIIPVARPRWVKPDRTPGVQVSATTISRRDLLSWADSCAAAHLDLNNGPSWSLHVQPFDNGSTGVSMTGSHVVGDAYAAFMAIGQAIVGDVPPPPYDGWGREDHLRELFGDMAVVLHDIPATVRALGFAYRSRKLSVRGTTAATRPAAGFDDDVEVRIPSIAIRIRAATWRDKASDVGGTPASLLADFACRLATSLGRTNAAGAVTLVIPVSTRQGADDHRAIALALPKVTVADAHEEHGPLRKAIREALSTVRADTDPTFGALALVPWVSRGSMSRMMERMFSYEDELPVSLSNLGTLPSQLGAIDGTPADWFLARSRDLGVRWSELVRTRGHLVIVGVVVDETLTVCVESHQGTMGETSEALRDIAADVLQQFDVPSSIECS